MRLPQSILRYFSVHTVNFLTIGIAIALFATVTVSASVATPQLTCTPAHLNFGTVVVSEADVLPVTLTNNGTTSVTVSGIVVSNSEFTMSSLTLPLVLAAGQSFGLSMSFTPAARGWTYGTIEISSTASNATLVLAVEGAGVHSAFATTSPSSVSFGQVAMGTSSTVPVVLKNSKSSILTLSELQTTGGGFSISAPALPLTLAVGQTVTLSVTFAPQASGADAGILFVSGPGLAVPLTGTGTAPQYSVNLLWNASSGVEGYNVYRSTAANGTYSKINPTLDSGTAYTDSTVVSGQIYYYAATSVSPSGMESGLSTPPVQAAIP
jgi:hypothetical protein